MNYTSSSKPELIGIIKDKNELIKDKNELIKEKDKLIKTNVKLIEEQEQQIDKLTAENLLLKEQLFGSSSEKSSRRSIRIIVVSLRSLSCSKSLWTPMSAWARRKYSQLSRSWISLRTRESIIVSS